jgi:ABC-type methionine transport system permease subunit
MENTINTNSIKNGKVLYVKIVVILTYRTLPFLILLVLIVLIVFSILTDPLNYNNKF